MCCGGEQFMGRFARFLKGFGIMILLFVVIYFINANFNDSGGNSLEETSEITE